MAIESLGDEKHGGSSYKGDTASLEIDYAAEKRLVRKFDLFIIPMVMLLYLFSFLDR